MTTSSVTQKATDGKGDLPEGYIWPLSPEQRRRKADEIRAGLDTLGVFIEELPDAEKPRYVQGLRGEIGRLLPHLNAHDLLAVDLLVMGLAEVGPAAGYRQRLAEPTTSERDQFGKWLWDRGWSKLASEVEARITWNIRHALIKMGIAPALRVDPSDSRAELENERGTLIALAEVLEPNDLITVSELAQTLFRTPEDPGYFARVREGARARLSAYVRTGQLPAKFLEVYDQVNAPA